MAPRTRHPLWSGLVWALRFWVAGGIVVAVAYIAAPISEGARSLRATGRHASGVTASVPTPRAVDWRELSYRRPISAVRR